MALTPSNLVRLRFPILRDADGYPPVDEETLWAESLGDGLYRVDNIPFFARGVSLNDIVEVVSKGDKLHFARVKEPSGHSTVRVIVFDRESVPDVRARLEELGGRSELSHLPRLIAVDVPPSASWTGVHKFLDHESQRGRLDYEEAVVAHR